MQRIDKALSTFRNPYNCAQTVSAAFGHPELLEPLACCGRGNAPGGMCGSLYAATLMAPGCADMLKAAFEKHNGTLLCRTKGASCKLSCPDCVRLAATLLVQAGL